MQVGDWLTTKGVDRNMLTKLLHNAQQHEVYMQWVKAHGHEPGVEQQPGEQQQGEEQQPAVEAEDGSEGKADGVAGGEGDGGENGGKLEAGAEEGAQVVAGTEGSLGQEGEDAPGEPRKMSLDMPLEASGGAGLEGRTEGAEGEGQDGAQGLGRGPPAAEEQGASLEAAGLEGGEAKGGGGEGAAPVGVSAPPSRMSTPAGEGEEVAGDVAVKGTAACAGQPAGAAPAAATAAASPGLKGSGCAKAHVVESKAMPTKRVRLFPLDPLTRRSLMTHVTTNTAAVVPAPMPPGPPPLVINGVPMGPVGPPVVLPFGSAAFSPHECIGHCCRVYWYDDYEWYDAEVFEYDASTGRHNLYYHLDDATEWIDLRAEEMAGRVQWLPYNRDPEDWPPPPSPPPPPPAAAGKLRSGGSGSFAREGSAGAAPLPLQPPPPAAMQAGRGPANLDAFTPTGSAMAGGGGGGAGVPLTDPEPGKGQPPAAESVGWRVRLFLPDTANGAASGAASNSLTGIVCEYDAATNRHRVEFEDGQNEWVELQALGAKWLCGGAAAGEQHEAAVAAAAEERAASEAAAATTAADMEARRRNAPAEIPVTCNGMDGVFLVFPSIVRTLDGRTLSPTEFERIAGKAASKKWKVGAGNCAWPCPGSTDTVLYSFQSKSVDAVGICPELQNAFGMFLLLAEPVTHPAGDATRAQG